MPALAIPERDDLSRPASCKDLLAMGGDDDLVRTRSNARRGSFYLKKQSSNACDMADREAPPTMRGERKKAVESEVATQFRLAAGQQAMTLESRVARQWNRALKGQPVISDGKLVDGDFDATPRAGTLSDDGSATAGKTFKEKAARKRSCEKF